MIAGLHAPNAHITPSTLEIVQRGGFKACKVMHYHNQAEIKTLQAAGVTRFLVRSEDSVWAHSDGRKYIPSYFDYGAALLDDIMRFYGWGLRDFQIDCEPNISWKDIPSEYGPWQYRAFMLDVLEWLAPHLPSDVRLFAPPMSFAAEYNPLQWLTVMQDVFERFAGLCANCYWQSSRTGRDSILAGPLTWQQFGANFKEYARRWPPKHVIIAEWGSSIQETGRYTSAQVDAFRVEQYPIYLQWLAQFPYVEVAYVYLAPTSTPEWRGFEVSRAVASAMKVMAA